MCFKTTKSAKAKIAEIDIECWKALDIYNGNIVSACENHIYKPNTIQPNIVLKKLNLTYGYEIRQGYHSCKTIKEAKTWGSFLIVEKFIIPKGTMYYSNRLEYVSETIILIK